MILIYVHAASIKNKVNQQRVHCKWSDLFFFICGEIVANVFQTGQFLNACLYM